MRIIMSLIIFLGIPFLALPATLKVPGQYPTIQDAIDAASGGDTVLVAPGTYVENIDFKGKAIVVKSEMGKDVTIIDGSNPADPDFGSVVIFQSGEGLDSRLEGFTIQNGTGTREPGTGYFDGGGIYVGGVSSPISSSPTIIDNRIRNNSANRSAGGISVAYASSPDIIGNTISENSAVYGAGIFIWLDCSPLVKDNLVIMNKASHEGGGIQVETQCAPIVDNNIIVDNYAKNYAGGLIFWNQTSPIVTNNVIMNNQAEFNGGGGILLTYHSTGIIAGNIIAGNTAAGTIQSGGGILVDRDANPLIANNVIYGNTANRGGGIDVQEDCFPILVNNTLYGNSSNKGGALACRRGSTATVMNTLFWDNHAATGPEIFIGSAAYPSTVTISHSDVEGGQASVNVEPNCTLNWGQGMIDADPLFVDAANGDFHLTYPSPCKDTGDNVAVTELTDFEGDPRIAYGTVDMGADEFYTHLYWTGDALPGGNVEVKLVGLPGTSPVGLCIGTGVLDPPLPSMWGDWYLQFPILGPISLPPIPSPGGVLVIPATIPTIPPPPYSIPMQALVGAELTNLSVMEVE